MTPEIQIVPDVEALYRAGAAEFVRLAGEAVVAKGSFTVALSGGSTPKGLYGSRAG
jgi:6-phosphogluconolactonase